MLERLKTKVGPLPMWGWILIATAVVVVLLKRSGSSSSTATGDTFIPTDTTGGANADVGGSQGAVDPGPGGGSISVVDGTTQNPPSVSRTTPVVAAPAKPAPLNILGQTVTTIVKAVASKTPIVGTPPNFTQTSPTNVSFTGAGVVGSKGVVANVSPSNTFLGYLNPHTGNLESTPGPDSIAMFR